MTSFCSLKSELINNNFRIEKCQLVSWINKFKVKVRIKNYAESIIFTNPVYKEKIVNFCERTSLVCRMQNSIVVHVCPMNFFYVFIVPGPILRHLGELGKIRLLLGENTRFLPKGVNMGI